MSEKATSFFTCFILAIVLVFPLVAIFVLIIKKRKLKELQY